MLTLQSEGGQGLPLNLGRNVWPGSYAPRSCLGPNRPIKRPNGREFACARELMNETGVQIFGPIIHLAAQWSSTYPAGSITSNG